MALVLWCPSHYENLKNARNSPRYISFRGKEKETIELLLRAIELGDPLPYQPENVLNFNYLQCAYSERFIFSDREDFWLIRDMLQKDHDYKIGPRATIS